MILVTIDEIIIMCLSYNKCTYSRAEYHSGCQVKFVTLTGDPQGQNNINNYTKTLVSISNFFMFVMMVKK